MGFFELFNRKKRSGIEQSSRATTITNATYRTMKDKVSNPHRITTCLFTNLKI